LRPLTCEQDGMVGAATDKQKFEIAETTEGRARYEGNLKRFSDIHHSQCLFNRQPPIVPGLRFSFNDSGALLGEFTCNGFQQGYDEMVHGGVIAAIVDASMAQCLMGHGVVGYTVKLSVKYRKPVLIRTKTTLTTSITVVNCGLLYSMKCEIIQNRNLVVQAAGQFFKVK